MLTAERLRYLFRYDPETGQFWRRHPHAGYNINREAGYVRKGAPYREIRVDQKLYLAHRLAWLYMTGEWPVETVDHIDGIPANNAWANLRAATFKENSRNRGRLPNNTTGYPGVSRQRRRFRARIVVDGKPIELGSFDTKEAARDAYNAAAKEHFGEFARVA
ncbi:HNH endonuclease signature motif containing protein [Microvirga mediterraneensis]|uniref:HNH endonuclease n=1 Tax=Microvirga mediterraneensis TaxID=2754695 RepID=A0A838BPT2_9HYPH|nr:HNH endonuclease signature motif containing protein [Microvirga mediterraneensis]MBA1157754.1 HNH endonuclease [Microvirga mediterraneensis]